MKVHNLLKLTTIAAIGYGATFIGQIAGMVVRQANASEPTISTNAEILDTSGVLFVVAGVLSLGAGMAAVISTYRNCKKAPAPIQIRVDPTRFNPLFDENA